MVITKSRHTLTMVHGSSNIPFEKVGPCDWQPCPLNQVQLAISESWAWLLSSLTVWASKSFGDCLLFESQQHCLHWILSRKRGGEIDEHSYSFLFLMRKS